MARCATSARNAATMSLWPSPVSAAAFAPAATQNAPPYCHGPAAAPGAVPQTAAALQIDFYTLCFLHIPLSTGLIYPDNEGEGEKSSYSFPARGVNLKGLGFCPGLFV